MGKYDYLVVGCGLYGAVFAQQSHIRGKKVLVIDKRDHIGGNCYTEEIEGINVHKYGPHIFHTNNKKVWDYINQFAEFNQFINRPKVKNGDKVYSFPINLMTLYEIYGVTTTKEAKEKLKEVVVHIDKPQNLEEWIISKVGWKIYELFIKGYTTKQWGREPKELPISIIKRLPIRFDFNDNYYNDRYQGVPVGGYTKMFERMLNGIEVKLNTDYFSGQWGSLASQIVYTGKIDEYFDYRFGELEYRGLRFHTEIRNGDFQGNAVINYTDELIPFTRVIEHKHFEFKNGEKTVVTWEYPSDCKREETPYYPVNDERNNEIYDLYRQESKRTNLILGGRLATYSYLDMDEVIEQALWKN